MAKQLVFTTEAQQSLKRGVDMLANAVATLMNGSGGVVDRLRGAAGIDVLRTVFRPRPAQSVRRRRVAFFTTAPEAAVPQLTASLAEDHGAEVVLVSCDLADRRRLPDAVARAAAEAEVFLTEIKAAAVDVVAEGAAALILEELGHAQARGARIHAEICGYGATADGHHITTPSPGGAGAVRAARRALQKAGLEADRIDLVSAHATGTGEGDPTELIGINTLVGDHARNVSVTATKSSIGHTLGAAGAVAAVATVRALEEGVVPPTLNLVDPDERAGALDLTPLQARRRDLDVALLNSFGFGGQNAAIILRRWAG